jgi:hypothetical protein
MSEPIEPASSGQPSHGPKEAANVEQIVQEFLAAQRRPGFAQGRFIRLLAASNPFYPISAAVLLYGFYRVSSDPRFLPGEISQLMFNFTSLQIYELVLVATAIFLASRRIWYDSTLLVGLENMLVVVAFILVSQAALIDRRIIWAMCLAGGLLALCRFSALKRWMHELNLPARLLTAGMVLLLLNVALPIIFRSLHEHKVGTKPTWGPAYETNQAAWLLLLPALCAALNWMPARRQAGELWPQRWWLPATFCALWIAGTAVHLYCLGYVYDFDFRLELAAPAAWVLLWIIARRAREFVPALKLELDRALLAGPLAATLLAINQNDTALFFSLTLLNAACYSTVWLRQKQHRLALHLSLISIAALVAGVPGSWVPAKLSGVSRPELIAIAAVGYAMLCFALASNPKVGVLGGVVVGFATGIMLQREAAVHWGLQAAMGFVLLHSLRWEDSRHQGATAARALVAALWVVHSWIWTWGYSGGREVIASAVAVITIWILSRFWSGQWGKLSVPAAAMVSMLSIPGNSTVPKLAHLPAGPIIIAASFVLFALGTGIALRKNRVGKPENR